MLASKEQPTSNRVQTEGGNRQRPGRHNVMGEYIAVMMREESIVDDISIEALRDPCVQEVKRAGKDLVANVERTQADCNVHSWESRFLSHGIPFGCVLSCSSCGTSVECLRNTRTGEAAFIKSSMQARALRSGRKPNLR